MYDVVVLGSGPAGLTAALYTARAKMKTLVITGPMIGGQIAYTYHVDNYPGFSEGITGTMLSDKFKEHAERFGAEFLEASATGVNFSGKTYMVMVGDREIEARSIIIATGMNHRKLGIPGEERLMGRGVFVCATCDAALYEDRKTVVVGGGDSAIQEALDLARFASEVTIVHRREKTRACKCLIDRAINEPRIRFQYNTEVIEIIGDKRVSGVKLRDNLTGENRVVETDGVLLAIGWEPNTSILRGYIDLDDSGYPHTDGVKTAINGVFVAGELIDKTYRQLVTSCGSGCAAALESITWLEGVPSR